MLEVGEGRLCVLPRPGGIRGLSRACADIRSLILSHGTPKPGEGPENGNPKNGGRQKRGGPEQGGRPETGAEPKKGGADSGGKGAEWV